MAASNGDEDAAMDDSRTEEDERWDPKVRREQRARIRSIIQDVQGIPPQTSFKIDSAPL